MAKSFLTDITVDGKIYYANVFSQTSDLPSASTYHGMFAHVHATGKAYFAHAGNWVELLDTNTALLDGTGAANKIAFWTDADTLSNDTNLHWDSSNGRLGIDTSTPATKLHVYGTSTYPDLLTVTNNSVGINTQSPDRAGGLHIVDSGIKVSNSYGDMFFGQLYNHTDLRLATSTAKFYVSNGSSGPGGPGDTQLAPILVGQIGVKETAPTVAIDAGNATDAIKVPVGTTGERPTGAAGMFRYNSTDGQFEGYTTEWGAIAGSGGGSGGSSTISRDSFSGDGSTVNFTLSASISDEVNTQVYIDGVYQSKLNYSTSGTTLTFSTAPPTGSNNIEVVHISSVTVDNASTLNKNSFE